MATKHAASAKTADPTYKVVRFRSAGAWAGNVIKVKGDIVTMTNARRLWYWSGAASLSELAECGVKHPAQCKFPQAVQRAVIREWIEILDTTADARDKHPWGAVVARLSGSGYGYGDIMEIVA